MLELIKAYGGLMWPILACFVVAIVLEGLWTPRRHRLMPPGQMHQAAP